MRHGEIELELDVEAERSRERERPLEKPLGGQPVATPVRSASGGGEVLAGAFGQRRVRPPKLCLVAGCLLEVVAEELLHLDEVLRSLPEPGREALVQPRAGGLRERVVGGISEQQVPEAKAVLTGELRFLGADEFHANE